MSDQNEDAGPEPAAPAAPSAPPDDPPPETLPPGPDRIVKRGEPPVDTKILRQDFGSLLRKSGDGGEGEK